MQVSVIDDKLCTSMSCRQQRNGPTVIVMFVIIRAPVVPAAVVSSRNWLEFRWILQFPSSDNRRQDEALEVERQAVE